MELDELQVAQHRAGPQRGRDAVAGGHARVGRRRVDLADAAGGEHDGACAHRADAVALALAHDVQGHAADPAVGGVQQVEHHGVLDHLDAAASRAPRSTSARSISAPVASPPACAMRSRW